MSTPLNVLVDKYNKWVADPANEEMLARDNCTVVTDKIFAFYGHGDSQFLNWASNWSKHGIDDTQKKLVVVLPDGRELRSLGIQFKTTEHAMMWYKAMAFDPENSDILEKIRKAKSPAAVKKLGRQVKNYDDVTWSAIRLQVMIHILRLKAIQNQVVGTELRESGDLYIMEASKYDNIWGVGMYPRDIVAALETGEETIAAIEANPQRNLLGKAWMAVRKELLTT